MKKFFLFSLLILSGLRPVLVLSGLGLLSSCAKKDSVAPAPAKVFTSTMSATINNASWTANTVQGGAASGLIALTGTSSNTTELVIEMPTTVTPGTYSPDLQGSYHVLYTLTPSELYYISSGSIVVTSNANNTVTGTFSGTLSDVSGNTMSCSNGAFSSTY